MEDYKKRSWQLLIIIVLVFVVEVFNGIDIKKSQARLDKLEKAITCAQQPLERHNLNGIEVKARVLSGVADSTYFFTDINGIKHKVEVYNLVK